jgi:hypothetical protein
MTVLQNVALVLQHMVEVGGFTGNLYNSMPFKMAFFQMLILNIYCQLFRVKPKWRVSQKS